MTIPGFSFKFLYERFVLIFQGYQLDMSLIRLLIVRIYFKTLVALYSIKRFHIFNIGDSYFLNTNAICCCFFWRHLLCSTYRKVNKILIFRYRHDSYVALRHGNGFREQKLTSQRFLCDETAERKCHV